MNPPQSDAIPSGASVSNDSGLSAHQRALVLLRLTLIHDGCSPDRRRFATDRAARYFGTIASSHYGSIVAASKRDQVSGHRAARNAVHSDTPVGTDADELGRKRFAELIATQIALSRPSSGMVMSLTGAWGTGKSSVLRMVTESLHGRALRERIIVVNYNPWFFSGTDQLISGFLLTLADQLPKSLGIRWLLPDERDRLLAVLADDWLFARFLYGHTEPSFGEGSRPLAWSDLKG